MIQSMKEIKITVPESTEKELKRLQKELGYVTRAAMMREMINFFISEKNKHTTIRNH